MMYQDMAESPIHFPANVLEKSRVTMEIILPNTVAWECWNTSSVSVDISKIKHFPVILLFANLKGSFKET